MSFGRGLNHDYWLASMGLDTEAMRLAKLSAMIAGRAKVLPDVAGEARRKLDLGQTLTRREAAAFLGVSTKKLQRMESAGPLQRCPGMGTLVRYAARDVLRLASAR